MFGGLCLVVWDVFKYLFFKIKNNLFVELIILYFLKLCDLKGMLKYQILGDRLLLILYFCFKLYVDILWLYGEWLCLDGLMNVKLFEIIGDIFI